MAISATLKFFLTAHKIKYKSQKHSLAYTAQEIAAEEHVPGRQLAKCVLVKTAKGFVLAVLPAVHLVNLAKLKTALRTNTLRLATESEIRQQFPDIEVGAMSVFGNLYETPVIVDKMLAESDEIVCNAGTHTETIRLRYRDFEKLVRPKVGSFGLHVAEARHAKTRTKRKK